MESHAGEKYEGTLESTPTLSNDSGYITATPSTLCNDSPVDICGDILSTRWCAGRRIGETPLTTQKSGKINSLRKHLLQETCTSCEFENVNEQVDSSLCYSCASDVNDAGNGVHSPTTEGRGTLADRFSHLIVDETACDSRVETQVSNSCDVNSEVFHPRIGITKLSSNSKKKATAYLGKGCVKKFKQDFGSVTHRARSESTVNNSSHQYSYSGVSRLDFLVHLAGVSGCFPGIISQILSYLPPEDLVTVCLVSSEWRKVCVDDPVANRRRLAHVRHVKHAKENITWEQFKQSGHSLNISLASNKGVFREIQNTARRDSNVSTPHSSPRSPPVSPSKVRFNIFFKAGVALDEGTHLVRCPRCSHPSQATSDRAQCQAVGCQYNFCVFCLCDIHEGPCPGRTVLPVRRKITCVGSKESRRNLRRL